jgi:hypothetical protein
MPVLTLDLFRAHYLQELRGRQVNIKRVRWNKCRADAYDVASHCNCLSDVLYTQRLKTLDKAQSICHYVLSSILAEGKMSVTAHLAELTEKHKVLEKKIQEELARPGVDSTQVSRLKLEKLRLKDEIARLSGTRH